VTESSTKEIFSFQTEVGQLLDIVARSLYSNREIFLRELVSNAFDACDKLRYETLTDPSLAKSSDQLSVSLEINKKAKTLSISDNGIGMNHGDLLETLGTVLSDKCEPVSAKTMKPPFMPHRVDATQQERRFG
jgi:molecular chaperone HtpG